VQPTTLGESFQAYLNQGEVKSAHTLAAYTRSVELLFKFLADRGGTPLPVQQRHYLMPEEIELAALSPDDAPIFLRFAEWLLSPGHEGDRRDKRPYALATVELRVAGVLHWFQFMEQRGWLPGNFWLFQASRLVHDYLKARQARQEKLVSEPDQLETVVGYYNTLSPPPALRSPRADPVAVERWEVKRLRNRALLHCLAETGGRISEILSLNLGGILGSGDDRGQGVAIQVIGKGGHPYTLHLRESLPAIEEYLKRRAVFTADVSPAAPPEAQQPLFVSHDPRYEGIRMSRIVAWRVVRRAAQASGLGNVSPQDFRHWRALQLLKAGHSPQDVQEYLGHRSVETVRDFYVPPESDQAEESK
jgi:site-specific recombinase XerD